MNENEYSTRWAIPDILSAAAPRLSPIEDSPPAIENLGPACLHWQLSFIKIEESFDDSVISLVAGEADGQRGPLGKA